MAKLLSVNVGLPHEIAWRGKTVYTSVWKWPVEGRRLFRRLNIDGAAQGDLIGHGGEHHTVFVYQMDSYHYSERELKRRDFTFGQFGENFTVEGLAESKVCVGDRYRIGGALRHGNRSLECPATCMKILRRVTYASRHRSWGYLPRLRAS